MRALDVTGQRFGRLIAVRRTGSRNNAAIWLYLCDCGETTEAYLNNVRKGNTNSCGCLGRENRAKLSADRSTHGHATGGLSPTYISWRNAKDRAGRSHCRGPRQYDGIGIGMCRPWRESFDRFLADMGERPDGTSLDRIDGKLGYQPGNCRWATPLEQCRNRKCTRWVEENGERTALADYAIANGVKAETLWERIKDGQSPSNAVAAIKSWISSRKLTVAS